MEKFTGYIIKFDTPDRFQRVFTKDSIDEDWLIKMKNRGAISDYKIDNIGVKLIGFIGEIKL